METTNPWDLLRSIPLFAPHAYALTCTPDGGQHNAVWRVQSQAGDHVVRLMRPSVTSQARHRECGNTEAAAPAGLAPAVLYVDERRSIIVTAYHSGVPYAEAFGDRT